MNKVEDRSQQAQPYEESVLGTVGTLADVAGMEASDVRGYGLVVGLEDRGSADCPPVVRTYLNQEMKKRGIGSALKNLRGIQPNRLINDLDTAVVEVIGQVPPGAVAGTRFDVRVRALSQTQTISLEGGTLYTVRLMRFARDATGSELAGKTLAEASGPIFVNPFARANDDGPSNADPRQGMVLDGGRAIERRDLALGLRQSSYRIAALIESRINNRFASDHPAAIAQTDKRIDLHLPPAYRDDPVYFLNLITHLYLYDSPGFLEKKIRSLTQDIRERDADMEAIALTWEGIGRASRPAVAELMTDGNAGIAFYTARTALRLEDPVAVEVLGRIARDPANPYQMDATRELGRAKGRRSAGMQLRPLLDNPNVAVRVAAYESLLQLGDVSIQSKSIGDDAFKLDAVHGTGRYMIFVTTRGRPRIALFGPSMPLNSPMFYNGRNDLVTISTTPAAQELTVFRRTRVQGRVSDPFSVPLKVDNLIRVIGESPSLNQWGKVRGLGLSYSQVVSVLYELCQQQTIGAQFHIQQVGMGEWGPRMPYLNPSVGRPETLQIREETPLPRGRDERSPGTKRPLTAPRP